MIPWRETTGQDVTLTLFEYTFKERSSGVKTVPLTQTPLPHRHANRIDAYKLPNCQLYADEMVIYALAESSSKGSDPHCMFGWCTSVAATKSSYIAQDTESFEFTTWTSPANQSNLPNCCHHGCSRTCALHESNSQITDHWKDALNQPSRCSSSPERDPSLAALGYVTSTAK